MDKEIFTKVQGIVEGEDSINGQILQAFIASLDSIEGWNEFELNLKNMGIELFHIGYIEANENQSKSEEYGKILKFLDLYIKQYCAKNNLLESDVKLEFINYGKTELVYVLTEKEGKRLTLLVKQPAIQFGKVKQEADNLIELKQIDDNVVAPIEYFQVGDQELYVTPYINQARCIASDTTWGVYVPEPIYRFESFPKERKKIVNCCMIAKLISLYDFEKQEGICSCKLGGGDFMLPKGWEDEKATIENTLNNLYLIAAREKINCSFDEYIAIIKSEFSRRTINEKQDNLIINIRGRVPMDIEDIEVGIKLGQSIIENREVQKTKHFN